MARARLVASAEFSACGRVNAFGLTWSLDRGHLLLVCENLQYSHAFCGPVIRIFNELAVASKPQQVRLTSSMEYAAAISRGAVHRHILNVRGSSGNLLKIVRYTAV